ncbi:MAG: YegS/Rv2252/BmrU family lipid kinase [Clostridia bacterium]|nr:YegS/Rv2252/BmrU family lipid kinase [Clostridia bacterium]
MEELHLFIINPHAGKGKEQAVLPERIRAAAQELGVEAVVCIPAHAGDARKAIEEAAVGGRPLRVYACGGDGTVKETVNAAAPFENASVGIYPCGSGNDYVKSLPTDIALCRDLKALMKGTICRMDLVDVDGELCCNMTNIGFDALVAHRMRLFRRIPLVTGPLAYSLAVGAGVVSRMSWTIKATFDGNEEIAGPFMLCAAGVGRVCGGKYMALPTAKLNEGIMDVCMLRQVPRRRFPSLIGVYKAGRHLEDPRVAGIVTYRKCKSLKLSLDRPAARAVDGEIIKGTEFHLQIRPGALRLILPKA